MKHAAAFSLALIFASTTLFAQKAEHNAAHAAVANVARASVDCPVNMEAQRQPGQGATAAVGSSANGLAQSLHLTVNNPRYAEVVAVRITVHGFTAKPRVSPARTAAADSAEIEKTIDLKLTIAGKQQGSADLLLPAFTSVSSINLDSVRYADGFLWRSSVARACHVVPDALMLVGKR